MRMDVRCQKCGIEYEFDDAKVTGAGVTVKCTGCGHVFKVKRETPSVASSGPTSLGPHVVGTDAAGPTAIGGATAGGALPRTASVGFSGLVNTSPGASDIEWMVRQGSGTVYRFKELTTLQKWIVERKVTRADEISKTGRTWKPLGEISELASFFQVVEAASAAVSAGAMAPMLPFAPAGAIPARAVSIPDAQPSPPLAPTVPLAPAPPPQRSADTADLDDLDDDDPVQQWRAQRRRRWLLAAAVGAVALLAFLRPWLLAGSGASHTGVRRAVVAAIASDAPTALAAALASLKDNATPQGLALQARVLCAQAAHAGEEERLQGLLSAHDAAQVASHLASATAAGNAKAAALAQAYPLITQVRAQAPDVVDGHLAAAAYNMEKAGYPEHTADLESARRVASALDSDDKSDVDAEIAASQALADARRNLMQAPSLAAAAKVPSGSDARLRYMKAALGVTALLTQKDGAAIDRVAVQTFVDALDVSDARTVLLRALLVPLASASTVDAGSLAAIDAGAPTLVPDAGVDGSGDKADAGVAAGPRVETYDALMQKAERARINEKSAAARDFLQQALKLKPSSSRAWLGLGWASLDLERRTEAIKAFQRALTIDDGLADAHFGLAEALRFSGQKSEAVEEYRMYLKMDPVGRDAAVAKNAIDALQ